MTLPTAVNDIADLSRILQENPEWREHFRALLLTPEILELPATVAALTVEVREFIAEQREINARADARMDALTAELREFIAEQRQWNEEQREINARAEARMDALTAELREFIAEQRQWNAEQRQWTAEQQRWNEEQRQWNDEQRQWNEEQRQWNDEQRQWNEEQRQTNAAIFARLDRIEADIKEMKADIKRLEANGQEMRVDIDEMKIDIKDMKGDLSQLKGRQAERDTHRNIVNLLQGNHPGLRRIVILKSDLIPFATELNDRIDDAEDEGLITADERKSLRAVDLVVRAIDRDTRETIYFAVEVSRTINNHDVTRAADRAAILGRIVQEQGIGAVVGGAVIPQAVQRAQERGVSVITSNRLVDGAAPAR